MGTDDYQIDDLDRKILRELSKDARASFVDIGKKLSVANATVHQRVGKLKINGILKGFRPILDEAKLGIKLNAIIGLYLRNAKDSTVVLEKLDKFPEITEAYYTTGSYALILKVATNDIQKFQLFLMDKLQGIAEIQSTESFICMSQPIKRTAKVL